MKPQNSPIKKQVTNKAIVRGNKNLPNVNNNLSEEKIASPWYILSNFFNDSARYFIPRNEENQKYQKYVAPIHHKCVAILKNIDNETWDEIIETEFEYQERREARDFFCFISTRPGQRRNDAIAPIEVVKQLHKDLNDFVQLAPYAFIPGENPDLVKLHALSEIMSYYRRSEKTFLFLSELPYFLDEKSRHLIETSPGYQEILYWGASKFLNRLWQKLQDTFKINVNHTSEETLFNLLRELEETTEYLKKQVQQLEIENEDLKNTIQKNQAESLQQSAYKLAKTLQTQPQPVLDQIFLQAQKLNKLSESGQKLSLSETDCLIIMITFNTLLKSFQDLKITPYPSNLEQPFQLNTQQMAEYTYVEGSSFLNPEDIKVVRCLRPGWRVGEEIVTPAPVKEIIK